MTLTVPIRDFIKKYSFTFICWRNMSILSMKLLLFSFCFLINKAGKIYFYDFVSRKGVLCRMTVIQTFFNDFCVGLYRLVHPVTYPKGIPKLLVYSINMQLNRYT